LIEETIRRFIVDELDPSGRLGNLADDYPLLDRGLLDSLGLFQLVGYLETEFEVDIWDEELVPTNFGSIGAIARLVRAKRP
jgi:acyl carrier protein